MLLKLFLTNVLTIIFNHCIKYVIRNCVHCVHLQDTSKLQCVEDFLEGMLGKRKFE
jgi:hypothetical protein